MKAWYHRRDRMQNFLIPPSGGDLCYTVLLNMPTGYSNPYVCQSINRTRVIIMFSLSPFSFALLLEDSAQRLIRDRVKIGQERLGTPWSIHHPYQPTQSLGTFLELF